MRKRLTKYWNELRIVWHHQAETDDPRLVQQAEIMEEDFVIQVRAIADEEPALRKLEQADWPMLQCYDPILRHVLDWMALPSHGRSSLGDHLKGKIPAGMEKPFQIRQKDFVLKQQMLYLKVTPSNMQEESYAFVVPSIKR